ncbi:TIGR03086 family protein [Saccharopolyspora rhizosphaerae]|uniref:TIGR03086 family protein n=1 Tax=Saccharopolyspora rhizosphaerae TaxID=2492662 RepID=A0A3R8Q4T2_9PSEU|nr:TIGR03086 family metal-binding protein [Saccharopolyspora rhizosphaerae]RRO13111.1 TIGR03086 family protein [Saccharopolyspora rhizosphaerae]
MARDPVMGPELVELLERSYATTSVVLHAVPAERSDAPSPCERWTVGQLGGHLVGGATYFGKAVNDQSPELPTEEPPAFGDELGAAFDEAARFDLAAFGRSGALDQPHEFAFGPAPGWVIANVSLSESVLHGWDVACAIGVPYSPDDAAVDAVLRFQSQSSEDDLRSEGMFGPAQPVPANPTPFQELLALTGRRP